MRERFAAYIVMGKHKTNYNSHANNKELAKWSRPEIRDLFLSGLRFKTSTYDFVPVLSELLVKVRVCPLVNSQL